jgi:hypothetical protein
VFAVIDRILVRAWVHLYWSTQIPLTSLFLCSGVLLERTLREDDDFLDVRSDIRWSVLRINPAWLFLAIVVSMSVAPLVLQSVFSEFPRTGRNTGRPFAGLSELVRWGFGGSLPESLAPITSEESARGVGHLPREITVPMGTLLVAAWIWISFSVLALIGRLMPSSRSRRAFLLVSPTVIGIACIVAAFAAGESWGWFDPRFFWPVGRDGAGIWESDPVVLRSFGPVLMIALMCVLLMHLVVRGAKRVPHETRARAVDASSSAHECRGGSAGAPPGSGERDGRARIAG